MWASMEKLGVGLRGHIASRFYVFHITSHFYVFLNVTSSELVHIFHQNLLWDFSQLFGDGY